jgi:uncharacterized membrane protein YqhA
MTQLARILSCLILLLQQIVQGLTQGLHNIQFVEIIQEKDIIILILNCINTSVYGGTGLFLYQLVG